MGILIDHFMDMEVADCVKVYDIFCRVGKQFDELDLFYSWCKSIGFARSSEYPEVEKISPKKLEVMDEFIRDKSALAHSQISKTQDEKSEATDAVEEAVEEDLNAIKALPAPPEDLMETTVEEEKEQNEDPEEKKPQQLEGDLLNLGEDHILSSEEEANKLALALFDGAAPASTGQAAAPAWEAVSDTADWETALVQSASGLSHQKTSLPGGFDMLLLDGMYQQAATSAAMAGRGYEASGSASSVALGSARRPAMLALPPTSDGSGSATSTANVDPFAASLTVAPPPYVQMSEMEMKQKLLVEEQLMWQQYARDGMQGQLGMGKLQPNPYNVGGYTRTF